MKPDSKLAGKVESRDFILKLGSYIFYCLVGH